MAEEKEELRDLTKEVVESERVALKSRFSILKSLPMSVSNEQLAMDHEIDDYLKDVLELNFHNGFATLGVLELDEFKVVSADLENKKFEFKYKGTLYASLRLLHMLTNTNREIKESEKDIMEMIENYYVISQNIPFEFDETGNITRNNTLAANVRNWANTAEFKCREMSYSEEFVLDALDKHADEAIKYLINSFEIIAQKELENLIGE